MDNKQTAVKEVQTWLRALAKVDHKIREVNVDGFYGEETENAVNDFQVVNGLPDTGVVDYKTWCMLYDQYKLIKKKKVNVIDVLHTILKNGEKESK